MSEHPLFDQDPEIYQIHDWLQRMDTIEKVEAFILSVLNKMTLNQLEATVKAFYGISSRGIKRESKKSKKHRLLNISKFF